MLTRETVKKVRMAVYSLIENSSFGQYPELFDLVFEQFKNARTNEAVCAFKALVLTGRHPFHKLMEMVREAYPSIISIIHMEISELSRLSFFAFQDIALNKEAYQGENYDINLACIFGMIKKRPERVVRILKENIEICGSDRIRKEVDRLMLKTQNLLLKERESIAAQFKDIQTQMPEKKSIATFFKSILKDPVQKKLNDLKQRIVPQDLDFHKAVIRDQDWSGMDLTRSVLNLSHAQIVDTLLTDVHVSVGICRNTLFYNMNLDGAIFDLTCFDNAVFVAAVNQVGENDAGLNFPGISMMLGPDGFLAGENIAYENMMHTHVLDMSLLEQIRTHKMRYFLPNRRANLIEE